MERRWDMIRQKAQWEWGDLRRFYLEKCCHEADSRGTSNQTGLGMGVLNVGKVYNRCSLWHKQVNLQQNQLHFFYLSFISWCPFPLSGLLPPLHLSSVALSLYVQAYPPIDCGILLLPNGCLPLLSFSALLHCIAECLRKAALEVIRIQGAGVSRHTLCCFKPAKFQKVFV